MALKARYGAVSLPSQLIPTGSSGQRFAGKMIAAINHQEFLKLKGFQGMLCFRSILGTAAPFGSAGRCAAL
jgi:hypothetical protein